MQITFPCGHYLVQVQVFSYFAPKNLILPYHGHWLIAVKHTVDIVDNLANIKVGEAASPTCAYALSTIGQHQGDDGNVPLRLHPYIVVKVVLEQVIIHRREQQPGKRAAKMER